MRHVSWPPGLTAFEALLIAFASQRSSLINATAAALPWIQAILDAVNPLLEDPWSFARAFRITHSHTVYKQEDPWCLAGSTYFEKVKADPSQQSIAKGLCTFMALSYYRRDDLLLFAATEPPRYIWNCTSSGAFCNAWRDHVGPNKQRSLYPGRVTTADFDEPAGKAPTMEVALLTLAENCKLWHRKSLDFFQDFADSTPSQRGAAIRKLHGFGQLNATHLALALGFVGFPTAYVDGGENGQLGSRWILSEGPGGENTIQRATARINRLLKKYTDAAPRLQAGEAQALLSIYIYALQTFFTGSNALHPRTSVGVPRANRHKLDGLATTTKKRPAAM